MVTRAARMRLPTASVSRTNLPCGREVANTAAAVAGRIWPTSSRARLRAASNQVSSPARKPMLSESSRISTAVGVPSAAGGAFSPPSTPPRRDGRAITSASRTMAAIRISKSSRCLSRLR